MEPKGKMDANRFMTAINVQDLQTAKNLLDNEADVNIPDDPGGNLPLHYICQYPETTESLKCFRRLIKDTSDINARQQYRNGTPFSIAVEAGNCQMVQELADSGCDINVCSFITAFEKKKLTLKSKMVEKLIHLGFNVNVTKNGMTPLMLAAASRDLESFKLLLTHGADVNIVNNESQTALMICAKRCNDNGAYIKLLLDSGSDVNIVDKEGWTALMMCAQYSPNDMKLLLDAGSDVNTVNNEGKTALMICAKTNYSNDKHIKQLLDAGADVNIVDKEGRTALMICVERKYICATGIKLLLDARADVNIVDNEGQTALMIGVKYKTHIKQLLDAGSNPNIQDKNGQTVLQYLTKYIGRAVSQNVAIYWNIYYLKLFLQYGGAVSLDIKTADGFTLLQYVLNTTRYSLFWHLLAENCCLESFKAIDSNPSRPSKMVRSMRNKQVKLGQILYLCGAPKQIIQEELSFRSNDENRFHRYCNSMSLKKLCRRRLRNSIGAGIQQKLSKDFQIPRFLHDFIKLKDVFPAKVFDPTKILEYGPRDKNDAFEGIHLNDDDDDEDNDDNDDDDDDDEDNDDNDPGQGSMYNNNEYNNYYADEHDHYDDYNNDPVFIHDEYKHYYVDKYDDYNDYNNDPVFIHDEYKHYYVDKYDDYVEYDDY